MRSSQEETGSVTPPPLSRQLEALQEMAWSQEKPVGGPLVG